MFRDMVRVQERLVEGFLCCPGQLDLLWQVGLEQGELRCAWEHECGWSISCGENRVWGEWQGQGEAWWFVLWKALNIFRKYQ